MLSRRVALIFHRSQMCVENCLINPIDQPVRREACVKQHLDQIGSGHVRNILNVFLFQPRFMPDSEAIKIADRQISLQTRKAKKNPAYVFGDRSHNLPDYSREYADD